MVWAIWRDTKREDGLEEFAQRPSSGIVWVYSRTLFGGYLRIVRTKSQKKYIIEKRREHQVLKIFRKQDRGYTEGRIISKVIVQERKDTN